MSASRSGDKHLSDALVVVEDLHVTLGGQPILRGLYARIAQGKITALIGLNGSGKTTFLRALLGEVPYTGTIEYHCGHDHSRRQPRHIGYVPQRLLFDTGLPLTVRELVGLATQKKPVFLGFGRQARRNAEQLLERVWAEHLLDRPVACLSGGELQRVLLGLALEPAPELLLLDEPAAGIDFKQQGDFYGLLDRINRETGVTVLLVSHDLSIVTHHAHHVLCLKSGRIECEGSPQTILSGEMISRIFGEDKALYTHEAHKHTTPPNA
ncbi:MAG: ABC transporter [Gemmataceae bacterium]